MSDWACPPKTSFLTMCLKAHANYALPTFPVNRSFFLFFSFFIPPVYEVYRGYIVFAFSVCVCVCVLVCV